MSDTETVTIARPRQMAEDLRQAVDAGEFASRDEAVQEAVREWQERRGALDYTTDEKGSPAVRARLPPSRT